MGPLHVAVRRAGCTAAEVTSLLAAGASVDAPSLPAGHTALHIAAMRGNDAVAHALLAGGAIVDSRDCGGNTPLLRGYKAASMVALLLAAGSDGNAVNTSGKSAMHAAAAAGRADIVSALLAGGAAAADVPTDGAGAATPLMLAAEGRHAEVVELLLAAGADCTLRSTAAGYSVLHSAVSGGHPGIVAACLAAGADPCAQATSSHSLIAPLHLLATPVSIAAAVALTADGPTFFNPWSAERLAGAMDAAFLDRRIEDGDVTKVCELLVAAGANVEAEIQLREGRDARLDVDGQRPLHIAACMGVLACPKRALEAVEALLTAGADAAAEDARGCRPLDLSLAAYSVIMSNSDVCEARLKACCAVMLRLLRAVPPGRPLLPLLRQLGRHNFQVHIETTRPVIGALEAMESSERAPSAVRTEGCRPEYRE